MKQETCLTGQLKQKNLMIFLGFNEIAGLVPCRAKRNSPR
ncbi:Unknown protein sequence [Pseudomonas syringae pv. cilantro]|uniref:Uncharacterized protein n=1 Tax=Pseudomonas syringae pv. cilantro TaxID=81035 RepID=A0A0N0X9C3_PSESX|nr:Unknown protein sequence [Pseudomonas syringae pv. cilantro]